MSFAFNLPLKESQVIVHSQRSYLGKPGTHTIALIADHVYVELVSISVLAYV